MSRITLKDKSFKTFIPFEEIERKVQDVANKLNNDYKNIDTPIFLSVLNGSFMFTASLMQKIDFLGELSFIKLASYSGTSSTGAVKEVIGLNADVKGRHIIIIEDIVDTGGTIKELYKILQDKGAADIKVCTLFLKPDSYKGAVKIDYPAMNIGNDFIVGYGLDYDQLGRQYKDIYVIDL